MQTHRFLSVESKMVALSYMICFDELLSPQKGNPVLKYIRNVPWEFGDIIPDYQLGQTSCALYLRWGQTGITCSLGIDQCVYYTFLTSDIGNNISGF